MAHHYDETEAMLQKEEIWQAQVLAQQNQIGAAVSGLAGGLLNQGLSLADQVGIQLENAKKEVARLERLQSLLSESPAAQEILSLMNQRFHW